MSDKQHRKTRVGVVVSDKMDKTVVVAVQKKVPHRIYKKFVLTQKKFKAHDPDNAYNVGDTVEIVETRPLSRDKHWRVTRALERAR